MPEFGFEPVKIRTFPAGIAQDGAPDPLTTAWLKAESLGFLIPRRSHDVAARLAAMFVQDGRVLTGAYMDSDAGVGWDADCPIATYATIAKGMNVGGARDLPVRLVADVTVRSTHRGRGLLSRIIRRDLSAARDHRVGAAALYAAKADLYGRYGFGPATRTARVDVSRRDFKLCVPGDGRIDTADPTMLTEAVATLHREHHAQTLGSVEMLAGYPEKVCGVGPDHSGGADPSVRALTHSDAAGHVDGLVTYRFQGWSPPRSSIEIIELLTADPRVDIALWAAVCQETAADAVVNHHCRPDNPLPWALKDRRAYRQVLSQDGLWLRIIDVPLALSARGFQCPDQTLTMRVTDPLELSAGTYRIEVTDGHARVSRSSEAPEVTLDISALSSIYLGGYSALELIDAGLITGRSPESLLAVVKMFQVARAPYCNTHF